MRGLLLACLYVAGCSGGAGIEGEADAPDDALDVVDAVDLLEEEPVTDPGCIETLARTRVTGIPADPQMPEIAWSGSEFGVTWCEMLEVSSYALFYARVDALGEVVGGPVMLREPGAIPVRSDIVWSGSGFGMAFEKELPGDERHEVFFRRISPAGEPLSEDLMLSNYTSCPDGVCLGAEIAWSGSTFAVGWNGSMPTSLPDEHRFPFLSIVSADGRTATEPFRLLPEIIDPGDRGYLPAVLWTGSEWATAWFGYREREDYRAARLVFARVAPSGDEILAGAVFNSAFGSHEAPAVAWTGSLLGLAWLHRDFMFTVLDPETMDLVDEPVTIGLDIDYLDKPDVVWTGGAFIAAMAVTDPLSGLVLRHPTELSSSSDVLLVLGEEGSIHPRTPELAWTGSEYGVVWTDTIEGESGVFLARVGYCD